MNGFIDDISDIDNIILERNKKPKFTYICDDCNEKFMENELDYNSLGDPRCPYCGSYLLSEID